jgi:hypothetical protein
MLQSMSYQEARALIKNGDLINLFRPTRFGLRSILYTIMFLFTGSRIYHCVIAMWMTSPSGEKRLMAVESNIHGGKRIIPLSIYSLHHMEVYALPETASFDKMEPVLMRRVGEQGYSLIDFLLIGLDDFFGIKVHATGNCQVCSELCADAWMSAGVPFPDALVSPGKLRNELIAAGITPYIDIQESTP